MYDHILCHGINWHHGVHTMLDAKILMGHQLCPLLHQQDVSETATTSVEVRHARLVGLIAEMGRFEAVAKNMAKITRLNMDSEDVTHRVKMAKGEARPSRLDLRRAPYMSHFANQRYGPSRRNTTNPRIRFVGRTYRSRRGGPRVNQSVHTESLVQISCFPAADRTSWKPSSSQRHSQGRGSAKARCDSVRTSSFRACRNVAVDQ